MNEKSLQKMLISETILKTRPRWNTRQKCFTALVSFPLARVNVIKQWWVGKLVQTNCLRFLHSGSIFFHKSKNKITVNTKSKSNKQKKTTISFELKDQTFFFSTSFVGHSGHQKTLFSVFDKSARKRVVDSLITWVFLYPRNKCHRRFITRGFKMRVKNVKKVLSFRERVMIKKMTNWILDKRLKQLTFVFTCEIRTKGFYLNFIIAHNRWL